MAQSDKHVFRAQDVQKPAVFSENGKTVFHAGTGSAPRQKQGVTKANTSRRAAGSPKTIGQKSAAYPGRTVHSKNIVRQEMPAGSYLKPRKRRKRADKQKIVGIIAALAVVLIGCGLAAWIFLTPENAPEKPKASADGEWPAQVGDRLIDSKPECIVSLSPMLTQVILSLPSHDSLKGVTEYCDTGTAEIKTVGTPLLPRPDEIAALGANYVLCQTPLTESVQNEIEQSGARVIQIQVPGDLTQLREMYGQVGALLMGNTTGRAVGTVVIDRLQDNLNRYKAATGGEYTALLLPDLSGMAATAETAEWALLGQVFRHPLPDATDWLAGAECMIDDDTENDLDQIKAADPDLLFLPSDTEQELLSGLLGELRAVQNGHVVFYDRSLAENLSPMLIFDVAKGAQMVCPDGVYIKETTTQENPEINAEK